MSVVDQQLLAQLQQAAVLLTTLSFGSDAMQGRPPADILLDYVLELLPQPCQNLLSALLSAHSSEVGLHEHLLERQLRLGVDGAGGQGAAGTKGPEAADAAMRVQLDSLSGEGSQLVWEAFKNDLDAVEAAAGGNVTNVQSSLLFIEQLLFQTLCDHGHQELANDYDWNIAAEEPYRELAASVLCGVYDDLSIMADQLLVPAGAAGAAAGGQQQEQPPDDTHSQLPAWLVHLMGCLEVEQKGAPAFNRWGGAEEVHGVVFKGLLGKQYEDVANLADVLQEAARTLACDTGFCLYATAAMREAAQVSWGSASSTLLVYPFRPKAAYKLGRPAQVSGT
jgi:hypothetical protein